MEKKLLAGLAVGVLCVGLSSIQAFAATLTVDGGLLTGAQGVLVGNDVYDVKFVTGTPQGIFYSSGGWNFVFDNGQAISASQALLDQVFVNYLGGGMFDDNPSSIVGGNAYRVDMATPTMDWDSDWVYVVVAVNLNNQYYGGDIDRIDWGLQQKAPPFERAYALWSKSTAATVPEPATMLLMGTGLAVLVGARRKREK